jgi:hypothetical protein
MAKSRKMRWVGHEARIGMIKNKIITLVYKKFPILWIPTVPYRADKSHSPLSSAIGNSSISSHPISLGLILILSSHFE